MDLHPIIQLLGALASIAGGVKAAGEIHKRLDKRKMDRAYKASESEATPREFPPVPTAPQLSLELKVQAKELELIRAQMRIEQMQNDFRALRRSLDEAEREKAILSARLTEQELLNLQLVEEMDEIKRKGLTTDESDADNRRMDPGRVGGDLRRRDALPRAVRETRRKEGG